MTRDFENGKPDYSGARILVLGAAGFIGRWTARQLGAAGAKMFLTVRDEKAAQKIFEEFGVTGEICQLDLLDERAVEKLVRSIRPAAVFNLAGYGIDRTEQDERTAYRINARLIETLCRALAEARDAGWPGQNFIHAGTAMEYGFIEGDLDEDSAPNPTTVYGRSKLAGTLALNECLRRFDLKGVTARLFAVYGPGEAAERLLPTLIESAASETYIPLTAGLHKRDFIYVEDAAEALLRLGLETSTGIGTVNVATGVLTSIRDFVKTSAEVLNIAGERLRFGALFTRPEEMKHDPVTNKKLLKITGWRPATTIADGVKKTLSFERNKNKTAGRSNGTAGAEAQRPERSFINARNKTTIQTAQKNSRFF